MCRAARSIRRGIDERQLSDGRRRRHCVRRRHSALPAAQRLSPCDRVAPGRSAANSSWNIVNFRGGLIRALKREGYEPVVVAPLDPAAEHRMAELGSSVSHRHRPFGDQSVRRSAAAADYRRFSSACGRSLFSVSRSSRTSMAAIAARSLGIPAIANISGLGTVFIKRGAAAGARHPALSLRAQAVRRSFSSRTPTTSHCSSSAAWSPRSGPAAAGLGRRSRTV